MSVITMPDSIVIFDAKVTSIPRRIAGTSYEVPSCYFNVEVSNNKNVRKFRVECDDNTAGSALNAVEKGNCGDFYGKLDADRPDVIIVRMITLTS